MPGSAAVAGLRAIAKQSEAVFAAAHYPPSTSVLATLDAIAKQSGAVFAAVHYPPSTSVLATLDAITKQATQLSKVATYSRLSPDVHEYLVASAPAASQTLTALAPALDDFLDDLLAIPTRRPGVGVVGGGRAGHGSVGRRRW